MSASKVSRAESIRRLVSIVVLGTALIYWSSSRSAPRLTADAPSSPYRTLRSGDEILFIFVASSTCAGVKDPQFPAMVDSVNGLLRKQAISGGLSYATEAHILDWQTSGGLKFLTRFAPFDEISVGRNWLNSGAVEYIWSDVPGEARIPQLLVLRRQIAVTDRGVEIGAPRVVTRKIGSEEIRAWLANGADIGQAAH